MTRTRSELRFILYAGGIFVCYFIFAMLQEKITRGKYGDGDKFTCTLSLVLVQCVVNYIFAQILMVSWKHEVDTTRKVYYFSSALTYLLGMVSSNMALQWINYPTQVVGKAAKPIPVMILGVLIGHKSYALKKYFFVLLIVIGVVLFMYKDQVKVTSDDSQGFGVGELLLIMSLTMDGLTGAVQERIKSESSPTAYSMMLNTNWWNGAFEGGKCHGQSIMATDDCPSTSGRLFVTDRSTKTLFLVDTGSDLCVFPRSTIILAICIPLTGEIFRFTAFVSTYPEVLLYLAGLALMGALGQLFIFFMVSEFGPLPCSVVTTTRKFFTVLASVIIFGNVLLGRQWIGAIFVFLGLFLDIFYSKGKGQPKKIVEK